MSDKGGATPAAVEQSEQDRTIDATDGPPTLVGKIAAAMAETQRVQKDKRNTHDNYDYASIEVMLEEVREPLFQRGVLLVSKPVGYEEHEVKSANNKAGTRLIYTVDFTFTDGEREFVIEGWKGEGVDYGDKAYGKAKTNAIKTFIRAQWLLPAGDDAEADSPERVPANGKLPAWAHEANDARKRELLVALTPLIGHARALSLAKATKDHFGTLPDLIVGFTKGLATHIDSVSNERVRVDDPAERQAAAEAQATAEAPDDAEGGEEPPPDAGTVPPEVQARPPVDSIEPDDERARELCSCQSFDDDEGRDDQCPVKGHGIPF